MNHDRTPAMDHARNRPERDTHRKPESRPHTGTTGHGPAQGVERFLDRLRHLTEAERLTVDALDVLRSALGSRRGSAWLFDEQRPGFRLVSSFGFGEDAVLPDTLPDALVRLFPSHIDLDASVGP